LSRVLELHFHWLETIFVCPGTTVVFVTIGACEYVDSTLRRPDDVEEPSVCPRSVSVCYLLLEGTRLCSSGIQSTWLWYRSLTSLPWWMYNKSFLALFFKYLDRPYHYVRKRLLRTNSWYETENWTIGGIAVSRTGSVRELQRCRAFSFSLSSMHCMKNLFLTIWLCRWTWRKSSGPPNICNAIRIIFL